MTPSPRSWLLAVSLLALAPLAQAACDDSRGTLLLRSDNDLYGQAGQDQGYSAGANIAWVSPTLEAGDADCLPAGVAWLDRATGWLRWGGGTHRNLVLSWHHAVYTPVDGTRSDLIPDDRPYAGVMLFGLGQNARDGERLAATRLRLGIVGPSASADREVMSR